MRVKILKPRPLSGKNTPICVRILQLQISRSQKFHEGEQKHRSVSFYLLLEPAREKFQSYQRCGLRPEGGSSEPHLDLPLCFRQQVTNGSVFLKLTIIFRLKGGGGICHPMTPLDLPLCSPR